MALRTILLTTAALAGSACTMSGTDQPTGLRDISPAALAALPEGIDPEFLIRDANGCYGIAIEAAEIPTGPPLRDAFGNVVCDT